LSTFQKRDDASFFPQEGRDGLFPRLSVHGSFKKDGRENLGSGEGRRGHDAHAHFMHQPEHFGVAAIGAVRNAVEAQRAGRRSAALVERGDEAVLPGDLRHHLVIGHDRSPRVSSGSQR